MMLYFTEAFKERFMAGQADEHEMLQAMAELVQQKEHWRVRGYYRRLAQTMIDGGYLDSEGNIL